MKRVQLFASAKRVFAVFATTLLFAGCEELFPGLGEDPEGEEITITATTEKAVSRTTLNASDEVVWQEDDMLLLYDIATGLETESFILSEGAGTTNGKFTGRKPAWSGASWVSSGPVSWGTYNARVNKTQEYSEIGFAQNVNPMGAVCEDLENGIQFKNLAGIIELNIKGAQNLASIEVSANEHLSGYYDLDHTTLEKSTRGSIGEGAGVTLANINVQLDESKEKAFKIVVIPGTYTGFTVKMTNVDGSVVTKTAEESIVVERSKITPITGLVDSADPIEIPKYVTLSIVEAESSWHHLEVQTEMSSEISAYQYMWGTDEFVAEWMAENPNKQVLDMILAEGSTYTENSKFGYDVGPGINYNFYAVGLAVDSDLNIYVPAGDIHHISRKTEIPYDNTAQFTISVPEASITEKSAVAAINATSAFAKIHLSLYTDYVENNNTQEIIFREIALRPQEVLENVAAGATVNKEFNNLAPSTTYFFYAVGITAEGKYTPLVKKSFKTPEHVAAQVSATATIAEVKEWSAKLNIKLSEGAVGYKIGCWTKATYEHPSNANVNWAFEVHALEGMATGETFTLVNLNESTDYVCFALAYDASNNYGEVSKLEFSTTAVTADSTTKEYDNLLGNWVMEYTDSDGHRVTADSDHTITITQNVEGKLYNIRGLLGHNGYVYNGTGDDTVIARFLGDGNGAAIDYARGVKDISGYAQNYEILCLLVSGTSIFFHNTSIWAKGDGTYGIGNPSDPTNTGYAFGVFDKSDGAFVGVLNGVFKDVTLKKIEASGSSASTEKFSRQETVSPTWKGVAPARIEKHGLRLVDNRMLSTMLR